jgi:hypothetical protein
LWEQHLQKRAELLLMVLQAWQISAPVSPVCNLATSMRLPKAIPDALVAGSTKEAGMVVMDALLDEGPVVSASLCLLRRRRECEHFTFIERFSHGGVSLLVRWRRISRPVGNWALTVAQRAASSLLNSRRIGEHDHAIGRANALAGGQHEHRIDLGLDQALGEPLADRRRGDTQSLACPCTLTTGEATRA